MSVLGNLCGKGQSICVNIAFSRAIEFRYFYDRDKIEKLYFTWKSIMTIAEQIYKLVQNLPQDQANEVLTFTEFVCTKHLNNASLNRTQSRVFKSSLERLHSLTENSPAIDPVAWIQEGRQDLNERGCL
jgi:hypothetical protein